MKSGPFFGAGYALIAETLILQSALKPHSVTSLSIRLAYATPQIDILQTRRLEDLNAPPSSKQEDYDTLPPHLTCTLNQPIKASVYLRGKWTIAEAQTCIVPIGSKIGINHAFDYRHTIITTLNSDGAPAELEVVLPNNTSSKQGIRFVVRNEDLDSAIGIPQTWIKKARPWRDRP